MGIQTLNEEEEEEYPEFQTKEKKRKKKNKRKRDNIEAAIQVVKEQPNKSLPLVGYFPSGFSPNHSQSSAPSVRVLRNKKRSNRVELVVSPDGSNVDYVGKSYAGEAKNPQACTFALGVLDKETNVLKIVPVASNKIFRLEPKVRGSDSSEKELASSETAELTAEDRANKLRELNQIFGTKRTITRDKKLDALNKKEDPEMKEELDRNIREIGINKEALASTSSTKTAYNVPPYDLSATTPQQAYPLDRIILQGEWDYLLDIHNLLHEGADRIPEAYPTFVCNRYHRLQEIEDEAQRFKLAAIHSFITHLIKFKDQHSINRSSAKYHKIPSILSQRFMTLFDVSDSRRLPDDKIALLINYVLVLTLFADDFRTDLSDLAKDLGMSLVRLKNNAEHLGCKFASEKGVSLATLPVPLKFPVLRMRRKR